MNNGLVFTTTGMELVAGVDGVTGGWVMAVTGAERGTQVEFLVRHSFQDLWADAQARRLLVVGVDIPIGLSGVGRRTADIQARARLGGQRQRSVFHAPAHCTVTARNHSEAYECNRRAGHKLSPLALSLLPKIREVRDAGRPDSYVNDARPRLAEVHPEVSFTVLAGAPMPFPKKNPKDSTDRRGAEQRLAVLTDHFPNIADAMRAPLASTPKVALDDVLDAAAAAWTARRIASGEAMCLGEGEFDETGYPMNIWA